MSWSGSTAKLPLSKYSGAFLHTLLIGPCVQREAVILSPHRGKVHVTVDIDKLLIDILINCPIATPRLLHYVCFSGGWASGFIRHQCITVQKLSAGLGSATLTDRPPAAGPSTPQRSRCPLTTLSRAVGLISHSSLITWNQTLKEGGSHNMGSLIKSEKYGRQMQIKSERQRDKNKDKCCFQRLDHVGICSVASLGVVKASSSPASKAKGAETS